MTTTKLCTSTTLRVAALACCLALSLAPRVARGQPRVTGAVATHGDVQGAVGNFYGVLSPYGRWVNHDTFGWVWVPHRSVVGAGFVPYASNGSWTATNQGWMFASDYPWGWVPFHYGRWFTDPSYGWCWVPGTTWAPAWVSWRWGNGYVGWQPRWPAGYGGSGQPWVYLPVGNLAARHPLRHRLRRQLWRHAKQRTRVFGRGHDTRRWHHGPPASVVRPRYVVRVRAPAPRVLAHVRIRGRHASVTRRGSGAITLRRQQRAASRQGTRVNKPRHPAAKRPRHPAAKRPRHPAAKRPRHPAAQPPVRRRAAPRAAAQPRRHNGRKPTRASKKDKRKKRTSAAPRRRGPAPKERRR